MLAVPPWARVTFPTINSDSWESIGVPMHAFVLFGQNAAAWPAANVSILVPFSTWQVLTVKEVYWINGATVGGNIDIGIYNSTAVTLLASLGSTARGTVSSAVTSTTWTDYVLPAGDYYMAMSVDGTSNIGGQTFSAAGIGAALGVLEATSNFPLATGITPVVTTRTLLPQFGLLLDSTAI